MPNRDFIDDDLVQRRDDITRIKMGPGDEPARTRVEPTPDAAARGATELDLPLMARHKQAIDLQTAQNAQEIERLRQLQEDLEREKRDLEDARRKQADFIKGKQELSSHLAQTLVALERNELKAAQTAELLQSTRRRFRELLEDISSIHEEAWTDDTVRSEIAQALVKIEDARMEYNKSMARVDAVAGPPAAAPAGDAVHRPVIFEEPSVHHEAERTFGHWFMVGLAASLPLILTLVALAVLLLMHQSGML